jgi:predicted nucleotidyltransferase
VNDPEAPALDPAIVFAALMRHGVEFVLVGGLASQAHGATRLTEDLDLCPAWTSENLDRVAAALKDLGARLKIGEGSIDTLEVALDGRTIANMEIGTWRTLAGDIDVLLGIPRRSRFELARYDQLFEDASVLELGGVSVPVASLEDIIRSKEIADRPKDRLALVELRDLLEQERDRGTRREHDPPDLERGP